MPGRILVSIALAAALATAVGGRAISAETPPGGGAAAPASSPTSPATADSPLLYFFSPDWRPSDFGDLTVSLEAALRSAEVPVSVQAFTRYEDFRKQVLARPPSFLIAPAWIESEGAGELGLSLRVLARPRRQGRTTYRKALMTKTSLTSIDDLAHGTIAATLYATGPGSASAVLDPFRLVETSVSIVAVPKDIDALLALSFGQVDAALVTSGQYDIFSRSNPAEAANLRVLAFSPDVALPPVFATGSCDEEAGRRLAEALTTLASREAGRQSLEILGFDGYVAEPLPAAPGPRDPSPAKAPR